VIRTYLTLAIICLLLGCSLLRKTSQIKTESPPPQPPPTTQVRSLWTNADAQLVAKEMITDCLSWAWVRAHQGSKGGKPVVTVAFILDKTGGNADCTTLKAKLEAELKAADQVSFVANRVQLPQGEKGGGHQQERISREVANQIRAETGANFILTGVITETTEQLKGDKVVNYQTDLQMVNAKTMAKVWEGFRKVWKPAP
jgi:hypothetical protein